MGKTFHGLPGRECGVWTAENHLDIGPYPFALVGKPERVMVGAAHGVETHHIRVQGHNALRHVLEMQIGMAVIDIHNLYGYSRLPEGGGETNQAAASHATVCGGLKNVADGQHAAIGGGSQNRAWGSASTIPGGSMNAATGVTSFAAGNRAKANHNGAFVWADSQNSDFASTADDQFLVIDRGGDEPNCEERTLDDIVASYDMFRKRQDGVLKIAIR